MDTFLNIVGTLIFVVGIYLFIYYCSLFMEELEQLTGISRLLGGLKRLFALVLLLTLMISLTRALGIYEVVANYIAG